MEFKTQTNAQNLENAEIVKSATPAEIVKSETPDEIEYKINDDKLKKMKELKEIITKLNNFIDKKKADFNIIRYKQPLIYEKYSVKKIIRIRNKEIIKELYLGIVGIYRLRVLIFELYDIINGYCIDNLNGKNIFIFDYIINNYDNNIYSSSFYKHINKLITKIIECNYGLIKISESMTYGQELINDRQIYLMKSILEAENLKSAKNAKNLKSETSDEIEYDKICIGSNYHKNIYDKINNLSSDIKELYIEKFNLNGYYLSNLPFSLEYIYICNFHCIHSYRHEDNIKKFKVPFGCEVVYLDYSTFYTFLKNENHIYYGKEKEIYFRKNKPEIIKTYL